MRTRSLAFAALILLSVPLSAQAQSAFLVKDLGDTLSSGSPLWMLAGQAAVEVDGALYFPSDDGVHGVELWRSDGTAAGTRLVRDVCSGACSSYPLLLTPFQHKVYWISAEQLWASDGTERGTAPFAGPSSPLAGRSPIPLGEFGGSLLLSATTADGSQGELWATDGTPAGTVLLRAFVPPPGNPFTTQPLLKGRVGGVLVFGTGLWTYGETLWATDGTAAGTVPLHTGAPGLDFSSGVAAGGRLFFEATDGKTGVAWVSDGTAAGTRPLDGVSLGLGVTALGSQVFFIQETSAGSELWKSDGTSAGTALVKDLPLDLPVRMTAVGNRLFFFLFTELWVSDGTANGTFAVRRFNGIFGRSFAFGDRLAFIADDGTHGQQPWVSDGTPAGTFQVAELHPGSVVTSGLGSLGGRWLFDARDDRGWFLWATDGTPGNLARIRRLDVQTSSFPSPIADLRGHLLFFAFTATGSELWWSDGSAGGTSRLKDVLPGLAESFFNPVAQVGDRLFFRGGNLALWTTTDGTAAGTRQVPEAFPLEILGTSTAKVGETLYLVASSPKRTGLFKTDGTDAGTAFLHGFDFDSLPPQLVGTGGRMFLLVSDSLTDARLWTSDGTVAGTKEVLPGHPLHGAALGLGVGSRLLFTTEDTLGPELWASDGTAAGTYRIAPIGDITSGLPITAGIGGGVIGSFLGTPLAAVDGRAFFVRNDGVHGAELWSTDGTVAGTGMVADIAPGAAGSAIESLTAVGDRVFFAADDGVHGRELWVSDGTAAGTRMVADIAPGAASSQPANLIAVDSRLLFAADDGVHGLEPWVSDGTVGGTHMVRDIAPGPLPSSPSGFFISGRNVYFSANDTVHGFELWAVSREALAARP